MAKQTGSPVNHGSTFKFHALYLELFDPLTENRKKPTGGKVLRGRQAGPHGPTRNSQDQRREIIHRFFSKWREQVGDDIYPALRLILPDKDRDRAMYGLKEKVLARYLVKIMKIDKNSEDAYSLTNWKRPGQTSATAGDFAGRVYEVISKRALRIEPGDLTIAEVNTLLDKLSADPKEDHQLPIMETFYQRMNAEELMWLIRVILRSMRVGATEKTFLDIWHPDAETLFNICSSLKRVCAELYKPEIRLESDERGVSLMACYQPQLAFFNVKKQSSFPSMVASMKMTEDDQEFWIEEKLDGERMQLHMCTEKEGSQEVKKFKFWSRKAKDYTYLYGNSFHDPDGSLTRYLTKAFKDGVENIVLDGEMITWDPELDVMVPFGTLKTAALSENDQKTVGGNRPFYRVFDILYLNNTDLTRYTLRDRRKALDASVISVHRRMEILEYTIGKTAEDIEKRLNTVIEQASEGLVVKNPRCSYRLGDRNDDWIKVKPEYMDEFGESLDCVIIGGYYGSGHRGGMLSSFLCGLRADQKSTHSKRSASQSQQGGQGTSTAKFLSFFKVGGGMTRDEYKFIQHQTDGKWHDWDPRRPPSDVIELADGNRLVEQPDQWIHPSDSLVVEVRAASVTPTDEYAMGLTLRFPRFARFRPDKDWQTALSVDEFRNLRESVEEQHKQNIQKRAQELAERRPGRGAAATSTRSKKPLTIAGYNARATNNIQIEEQKSDVFTGTTIFIMTDSLQPHKKSKLELEELIKSNGGKIVQSSDIKSSSDNNKNQSIEVVCIAERRTVKVASLIKRNTQPIIKPSWIFDCIHQARRDHSRGVNELLLLPPELNRHVYFTPSEREDLYLQNTDDQGDSYARDTNPEELKNIMTKMNTVKVTHDQGLWDTVSEDQTRGNMFARLTFYFHAQPGDEELISGLKRKSQFARARISNDISDAQITHIIVLKDMDTTKLRKDMLSSRKPGSGGKIPRIVTQDWIQKCWDEGTRVDEDKYSPLNGN